MGGWGKGKGDAWGMEGMDMWDMMGGMKGKGKGKGDGWGKGKDGGKGGKGKGKMSKAAMKLAKGEKVYTGKLVRFIADKNAGYIHSDDVQNEHGQEVYAFRNVLEEGKAGVGDDVCFFLHWSGKGQAQASAPLMRLSSAIDSNLVMKGTFKKAKDESKPYGFITSPEVQEYFGRDVYVSANLTEGLTPGGTVAFNCYLNKDGMPNASLCCVCEDTYEPMPGDLSVSGEVPGFGKGGGWGKGGGKGKDGKGGKMGKGGFDGKGGKFGKGGFDGGFDGGWGMDMGMGGCDGGWGGPY